jgi:hypothetical protein
MNWNDLLLFRRTFIPRREIETLFYAGSYDPVSGIVRYEGRLFYALALNIDAHPREFWLLELAEEKMKAIVAYAELRYEKLGEGRCDKYGNRLPAEGSLRDEVEREHWRNNVERPNHNPDLTDRVLGYFRDWEADPTEFEEDA